MLRSSRSPCDSILYSSICPCSPCAPSQIATQKASLDDALEKLAAQEKKAADLERAVRLASESSDSLRNKLESSEFARNRLEREVASHKAQLAKNQDEAGRVLRQQLDDNNGRILDLEARLAAACKDARAFQHRVADAERDCKAATDALTAANDRNSVMQQRLDDAAAVADKVCVCRRWRGRSERCAGM